MTESSMKIARENGIMNPDQCMEKIKSMPLKTAIEFALQLRSDDFGHDCHELLLAESNCLQYLGEEFLKALDARSPEVSEAKERERLAARVFIDASPSDPDITAEQAKAWFKYKAARDRVDELEKNNE